MLKQRAVEERGHVLEETGQLQQSLKLQTMKTNHLEDQLEELRTSHKVCVCVCICVWCV